MNRQALRTCTQGSRSANASRPLAPVSVLSLILTLSVMLAGSPLWPQPAKDTIHAPQAEPAGHQAPGPAAALLAAQQAFARKDWKDAAQRCAEVARLADATPAERMVALQTQAKSEVNLNEMGAADRTLHTLLALKPTDAEALYLLGFVLGRENQPRMSLAMFTRAAALQRPKADDLKLVGLDYVLLDDYPDAFHWLTRATAMDPANTEAWYDLGRVQMHQGQFPPAEVSFRRALALQPGLVKALDNLGLALEAQNRQDEALQAYTAAVRAQTGTAHPSEQPLLNEGALLNTRGSYTEAAAVLAGATAAAPGNARCWEELARADVGLRRNPQARAAMEQAVALEPGNPRFHFQLGRIYRDLGMKGQADAEFTRSSALYGSKSNAPQP